MTTAVATAIKDGVGDRENPGANARHFTEEQLAMDKDRVVGAAHEVKGTVKEAVGKAVGDAKLQAGGKAEKTAGKIQNAIGGVKDTVRDILKK
jgi:uncharacterized protein YjbJ (UPF0337 family)